MSAAAVAVALLLLAAGVIWGCVVDWMRHRDERRDHNADDADHHQALLREVRRHTDDDVRWRP